MLIEPRIELKVNQLIAEYLSCGEYGVTLHAFRDEASKKCLQSPTTMSAMGASKWLQEKQDAFKGLFRRGDQHSFFSLWDDIFHVQERVSDSSLRQLEFMLGVYFAVYPLLPHASHPKIYRIEDTMDIFKKFLETRGADQCKSSQFLQYCALPYVPDPRAHPSFHDLFLDTWAPELEERLMSFLKVSLFNKEIPRLVSFLEGLIEQMNIFKLNTDSLHILNQLTELGKDLKDLKKHIQELEYADELSNAKLLHLRTDYHNLIAIASDLVKTLVLCINGEKITPTYVSCIVQKLSVFKSGMHHDRFQQHQQTQQRQDSGKAHVSENTNIRHELVTADSAHALENVKCLNDNRRDICRVNSIEKQLDYLAVQSTLLASSTDAKTAHKQAFLLQALRFRLSKDKNGAERRTILDSFIAHDFLDIRKGKGLILYILGGPSLIVKEQLARLLNTIATDCAGREYLLKKDAYLVPIMLDAMKRETSDSGYRQNLLGALQKLSLRRVAQSIMNKFNTIDYLHMILKDVDSLSEYTIEYASALMMNLCLRTVGKQQCASNPEQTLSVLNGLIENDNIQVKTYVNGTLYSILSNPEIRDRARAIGMEEQLGYLRQISDDQLVKQIDFVIEKLKTEEDEENICDDISDDGEEDDNIDEEDGLPAFEEEEEANEIFPDNTDTLIGDALLESYVCTQVSTRLPNFGKPTVNKPRTPHEPINTIADFKRPITPSCPSTPSMGQRGNSSSHYRHLRDSSQESRGGDFRLQTESVQQNTRPLLEQTRRNLNSGGTVSSLGRKQSCMDSEEGPQSEASRKKSAKKLSDTNAPSTLKERVDFDLGFSTRPKLPRTPLNGPLDDYSGILSTNGRLTQHSPNVSQGRA
ncbi:hypothetical protein BASA50_002010 [Batrachochytrium salamandrivorans]|uniref:LisH domain-containing protein ARMC9 n=1 Tax=Batrachochytrium salamandrivorans TaxID=1357716 RepID=A0ABQ8FMH2_9FUNG|nr:hypothetical protein BASA62_003229 [Batrachochytrium salamandrivorans]KAH6600841.1 hypothetical protein BASA50_002010 [Batrachochytrium salamandrivorans]